MAANHTNGEVMPRQVGQLQQSAPVTTISTVAIQAGEARIILVILKVSYLSV